MSESQVKRILAADREIPVKKGQMIIWQSKELNLGHYDRG
jgi:hypothetical protein